MLEILEFLAKIALLIIQIWGSGDGTDAGTGSDAGGEGTGFAAAANLPAAVAAAADIAGSHGAGNSNRNVTPDDSSGNHSLHLSQGGRRLVYKPSQSAEQVELEFAIQDPSFEIAIASNSLKLEKVEDAKSFLKLRATGFADGRAKYITYESADSAPVIFAD